MIGLRFEASEDGKEIHAILSNLDTSSLTVDFLRNQFNLTEFRSFFLLESSLPKAISLYKNKAVEAGAENGLVEPVDMVVAERREAILSIEIGDNKMSCCLLVETAYGAANPSRDQLKAYLTKTGIIKGINESILDAFTTKMGNVPPGTVIKEVVANGKAPGQSRQARLETLVMPVQDRLMKPKLRDDGTVDMHDFGEIEMVEIGEPLMKRIPPVEGEAGFNVMGEIVLAPKPQDRVLTVGEGAAISYSDPNLLVAARRGVPLKVDSGMMVADAYCVGDVDLNTGNIEFDGTVVVQGSVKEGMLVKATGKILIRDYLESATIEAGDEVVIGKGILGRQKAGNGAENDHFSAHVITPSTVFANYIQYALVRAGGAVTAAKHIMHSDVAGLDVIVLSPKKSEGKIIGGVVRPLSSLSCNTLGGPSYIPTQVDFSARFSEQLTELASLREDIGERLNVVRGMREALRRIEDKSAGADVAEQVAKITNTVTHFESIIKELKARRLCLIDEVNRIVETLEITVQRALFPGVQVVFVQNSVPVKQERDGCRIKAKDDGITYYTLGE